MNVIWWIHNPSRKYQVANRVGEIHTLTNPNQWRHVPSEEYPADLLSRGTTLSVLATCKLWWQGPSFLLKNESVWPVNRIQDQESTKEERKNFSEMNKRNGESNMAFEGNDSQERTLATIISHPWRVQPT